MTTSVRPNAAEKRVAYLARLLERVSPAPGQEALLKGLRDRSRAMVEELAIPSTKEEEWRFTDLSPLLAVDFQGAAPVQLDPANVEQFKLSETSESRLVFVNGIYAPELSSVAGLLEGVVAGNLAAVSQEFAEIEDYLGKQKGALEVFTALNTAGLTDAAVVVIKRNAIVETPIHLLFISTTGKTPIAIQPRVLVVAEPGSACTLIEEYVVAGSEWCQGGTSPYFTNSVAEIWVGENAEVNHARIQREAANSFHIGKSAIAQGKDSRYTCTAITTGAQISRHNLEIYQTGEGTDTTLNGLTAIAGEQLADTHSAVVLAHPHGTARQLHKCIADDRAHSVFNGKVFVPKAAQLTDASQLNRNLLLSRKARVDTKPQLEIVADNVKCTHGATVSQLEADELFYLQSRGLDPVTSRNLLIDGFAGEIIQKLPLGSLGVRLSRCIACRTDI